MTPVPEDNSRVGYPFVAVPTEVQEAIYERELTLREAKVALRLIRLVEGFKRTSVAITMEELGASIGMDRVSCQKVVSGMLRDAILICHAHPGKGPGKAGRYSINRNVGEWRRAKVSVASDSNSGPASKCRPRQQVSVAHDSNIVSPETLTTPPKTLSATGSNRGPKESSIDRSTEKAAEQVFKNLKPRSREVLLSAFGQLPAKVGNRQTALDKATRFWSREPVPGWCPGRNKESWHGFLLECLKESIWELKRQIEDGKGEHIQAPWFVAIKNAETKAQEKLRAKLSSDDGGVTRWL